MSIYFLIVTFFLAYLPNLILFFCAFHIFYVHFIQYAFLFSHINRFINRIQKGTGREAFVFALFPSLPGPGPPVWSVPYRRSIHPSSSRYGRRRFTEFLSIKLQGIYTSVTFSGSGASCTDSLSISIFPASCPICLRLSSMVVRPGFKNSAIS